MRFVPRLWPSKIITFYHRQYMVFCFLAAEVTMEICHALKLHYNSEKRRAERSKDKVNFFFPEQRFDLFKQAYFLKPHNPAPGKVKYKGLALLMI